MSKKDALKTVVMRNSFYRDNFRRMVWVLLASIVLNIVLIVSVLFMSTNRPAPIFFASQANGQLTRLQPLSNPVMNNAQVKSWIARVAPQVYALDFLNYRHQLMGVQKYFTPFGWGEFLKSFNGTLENIVKNSYVSSAVLTGPPVVVATAMVSGKYSWKVQLPLMVTFTHGANQTTHKYIWTVVLQRMNNNSTNQLLGISQIIQSVEN